MAPAIIDKVKAKIHSGHGQAGGGAATTSAPSAAASGAGSTSTGGDGDVDSTAKELHGREKPMFDPQDVKVIFVLGGPGSGKGTQCARLVEHWGFVHLSAGDLLRAEQSRQGSQYGELIASYIREGQIVPQEITIALLQNAIKDNLGPSGKGKVLVDGFPRKMDQAILFDEKVCESLFTLFLTCTEEVMLKRLLVRGETSGRADDNEESIKKRFRTYLETTMPVIEHYKAKGKVVEVDSIRPVEEVEREIQEKLREKGLEPAKA